ncbi:MAG TPA: GGDEF domain-containing protein, partial [Candidatus Brocadiaceae bacterium]
LNIISSQAAISIENARLYTDLEQKVAERTAQLKLALEELEKLATTDKLTGAHNRRKFDEILSLEMSRARRIDQPLSMIIFDVDHFKRINDTFGHQAGDDVLKMLVGTVREKLRILDVLARWGGEEFIVLTTSTDLEGAIILAERVRAVVEEQCFSFTEHITISLGVAEYKQDDTADSFMQRADSALYRAKRNGRNKVESEQ